MRRALSSDSGFLGFLDLGLGLLGSLPSLRDQGSGVTEEWMVILGFVEGGCGEGRSGLIERRKEDFRESISSSLVPSLIVLLLRGKEICLASKGFSGDTDEQRSYTARF